MATKLEIGKLDKKISALSNVLAKLGKGTDLKDLIRIIRFPGWTTPAELAFALAMIDSMQVQAKQLGAMSKSLLSASKRVGVQNVAKGKRSAKAKK